MPFRHGSLSYARFRVVGSAATPPPGAIDEDVLARLAAHTLRPSGVGEPRQAEFGFCGGRHVFDHEFSAAHNVFSGERLLFGLRIDTNKVPAEIKRAYRAMAEATYLEDSETGFLSRRERTAAKEDAEERCRQELADGRYRRSKCVDVLWDLSRGVVLAPLFSDAVVNGLRELFMNAFELRLQPVTSGALAHEILTELGRERDYEDLKPSSFCPRPALAGDVDALDANGSRMDSGRPIVPWTHIAAEAGDSLGNEFLLWLWWVCEHGDGAVATPRGEALLSIDRTLDMECAWDATGRQTLSADGPGRLPEARKGLQNGKWPRKAGLLLAVAGDQFEAAFQADRFHLTGVKLPKPEEELPSVREQIEQRIDTLALLDETMRGMYRTFLELRGGSRWESLRDSIAAWIANRGPRGRDISEQRAVRGAAAGDGIDSVARLPEIELKPDLAEQIVESRNGVHA